MKIVVVMSEKVEIIKSFVLLATNYKLKLASQWFLYIPSTYTVLFPATNFVNTQGVYPDAVYFRGKFLLLTWFNTQIALDVNFEAIQDTFKDRAKTQIRDATSLLVEIDQSLALLVHNVYRSETVNAQSD